MKACSERGHHLHGSLYPKESVPNNFFDRKGSDIPFNMCLDCRNYRAVKNRALRKRKEILLIESVPDNLNVKYCPNESHKISGSIHPSNEVPIELFEKDDSTESFNSCFDCRKYDKIKQQKNKIYKKSTYDETDDSKFYCMSCNQIKPVSEKSFNKNGEFNNTCISCKKSRDVNYENVKKIRRQLKFDIINNYECSCYVCKSIYLPNEDNTSVIEINTYLIDGVRVVNIFGKIVSSKNFISENKLELSILHFDHLPENEQRERGLLLQHEAFISKSSEVSNIVKESALRAEVLKCQLVCVKCHVSETIRRERGNLYKTPPMIKKIEYANSKKMEGCENCGYKKEDLLRFFEFDHIDPTTKICKISTMVHSYLYKMEDLINEIFKCRILCAHCHIMHTIKQRENGIFDHINPPKKNNELNVFNIDE